MRRKLWVRAFVLGAAFLLAVGSEGGVRSGEIADAPSLSPPGSPDTAPPRPEPATSPPPEAAAGPDSSSGVAAAPPATAGDVSVAKGLLSVRFKDADLFEVMKSLSLKTGVRIKVDQGAAKKITLTFRDLPFDKGIRNLIRPLNHAMIWKKGKNESGMEVETLEELHVFREGHQGGETVDYLPESSQPEEGSKVKRGAWSEETRRRMLEKLTVSPSAP